ncbi:hypothetical protein BGW80DRAFT_1281018 [Lactifluus volemus]|nr:hypothetical protein BGW80DRAFT_1281018 [Lactifluus volemus]
MDVPSTDTAAWMGVLLLLLLLLNVGPPDDVSESGARKAVGWRMMGLTEVERGGAEESCLVSSAAVGGSSSSSASSLGNRRRRLGPEGRSSLSLEEGLGCEGKTMCNSQLTIRQSPSVALSCQPLV